MFGTFGKNDPKLEKPIDRVLDSMDTFGPDAPEYKELLSHLERLTTLQREKKRGRVSSDTMVTVAGNLVGILIIVAYERAHVMSSKGLGFISKP
jgi:hypothetical protein